MLYWAVVFLLVAILAAACGFAGITIAAAGMAKLLFYIFVILFVVSLVAGLKHRRIYVGGDGGGWGWAEGLHIWLGTVGVMSPPGSGNIERDRCIMTKQWMRCSLMIQLAVAGIAFAADGNGGEVFRRSHRPVQDSAQG